MARGFLRQNIIAARYNGLARNITFVRHFALFVSTRQKSELFLLTDFSSGIRDDCDNDLFLYLLR